jgi:hypothetical protein
MNKILQVTLQGWLPKFKGDQMLQEEEYHGCLLFVYSVLKQLETKYYVCITKRYTFPHVILRIRLS